MKQSKLLTISFICSGLLVIYIGKVVWFMTNAEKWFGKMAEPFGPMLFLLLFVFSALICGLLVLGYPIWLYLEKDKKSAVRLLFYNIGWILLFLLLFMFLASI